MFKNGQSSDKGMNEHQVIVGIQTSPTYYPYGVGKVEGSVTARISDLMWNKRTISPGYFRRCGKQKDMRCTKDHIFWWSPELVIIKRRSEPNCP